MSRIPDGEADLLLACDSVVGVADNSLRVLNKQKSQAIMNIDIDPVGVVGFGNGVSVSEKTVLSRLHKFLEVKNCSTYNIQKITETLMGNKTTANVMMLGIALQKGIIPVSVRSVEKALTLNGASVSENLKALQWGRWLAHDPQFVLNVSGCGKNRLSEYSTKDAELDHLINSFSEKLTSYQNKNYAESYKKIMDAIKAQFGDTTISQKTARALFKGMAIKDEYEVARLMVSTTFKESLISKFGTARPSGYYLAPPFLSFLKDVNGLPRKIRFGSWMHFIFLALTKLKGFRETCFDPFSYSRERKLEIRFKNLLISKLSDPKKLKENPATLEAQLDSALEVKGYGHIKRDSLKAAILALK